MAAPPPTLKHRRDFLACARARRWAAPGLVLQARRRAPGEAGDEGGGEAGGIRVGYTCSKKLGGAVTRNRAKRRLRAAAAKVLATQGVGGWDYVLVGRPEATVSRPFPQLLDDLRTALGRVHSPRKVRA
jgi:ribonuclease P protein component